MRYNYHFFEMLSNGVITHIEMEDEPIVNRYYQAFIKIQDGYTILFDNNVQIVKVPFLRTIIK